MRKLSTSIEQIIIKIVAARAVWQASKVMPASKLTLWHLVLEPAKYNSIAEGFASLPLPSQLKIRRKKLAVPSGLEEFAGNLTYGQKLFLMNEEPFDVGCIMRYVTGYYYPLYSGQPWDEAEALQFGRNVLSSPLKDLYPVAIHLVNLMAELVEREKKLLHREPTADEKAAGVDRLTRFTELTSLIFLMDSFRCTEAAVLQKPYDDCLVRFMLAKEQNAYTERLTEVHRRKQDKK